MILKTTKIIALFLLVTTGFAQEKVVEISGTMKNGGGKMLYLNGFSGNQQFVVDSATINKKGKYKMSVTVKQPDFFSLKLNQETFALLTLDEKATESKVIIDADYDNFINSYKVSGSSSSEEISKFTKEVYQFQEVKTEMNKQMYDKNVTILKRGEFQKSIDSLDQSFLNFRNSFIEKNYKSLASIVAIGYLNPTVDLEWLRKIENGLAETVPNSEYHLGVKTQLTQIEAQIKAQVEQEERQKALEAQTAIGAVAPELGFKSPTGEVITLESLRGNYVLIDFWASWCRPCRMENPNVVKLYNKYKDKGFTVYSVSLDKNKASWEKAILDDNLIWPNHVSDLKQWQTEATKIYGFNGIPYTVLIDKEGKIIGKSLRGPALESKLKEIFGE